MKTVRLAGSAGVSVPALGLGTWRLGESTRRRSAEVAALRRAFELGYRLIDTAEMYGEGGAEQVVGQALAEAIAAGDLRRDDVFIVTKVYPHNASARGVAQACDRSRARLRLDAIDLYLLHWRGSHPLAETIDGLRSAVRRRPDSRLGRVELRRRRHAAAVATRCGPAVRCQPGLLLGEPARHRVRPAAVATRTVGGHDGLLPDRPGHPCGRRRPRADRATPWHHRRPGGARVGAASSGCHRDSESGSRGPPAREPGRRDGRCSTPTTAPRSTGCSLRHGASSLSR